MITISISELMNSTETLQKLAHKELKAKLAWSIARLLKAADAEIQSFNEARMNLIKKYGEKDENGELVTDEKGNCKILDDEIRNFTEELNELMNSKIEINANKIRIEELETLDFTPAEMNVLEVFIDFGEDE